MEHRISKAQFYGQEKIYRILLKTAPPVMLAQLIQALYNIVDSLFVGRYAESGLTALSIIYPIQLLMIAFAVGTGIGINTTAASSYGRGHKEKAAQFVGMAAPLAFVLWLIFALVCWLIMPLYAQISADSADVVRDITVYGRIVCVFSFGLFFESMWTKVLQSEGDMKTPMAAQILGAVTNIILDPLLIFGMFGFPKMGIAGAAAATAAGQIAAALLVMKKGFRKIPPRSVRMKCTARIFTAAFPGIIMKSSYTFYIFGLNLILSRFSDQAVTVLGLYYKWQTFFFIPLDAMQTCIVPVVSFNYAAKEIKRCKQTLLSAVLFGLVLMGCGMLCFELLPSPMLSFFSSDEMVLKIGQTAFRIIGLSFLPMVVSLIFPVFFQAVGFGLKSSILTLVRTVLLFVPLGFIFSLFGLNCFWLTFPSTELITDTLGLIFYKQFLAHPYVRH